MNISYISESSNLNFRTATIDLIFVIPIIFLFTSKSIQSERQKNSYFNVSITEEQSKVLLSGSILNLKSSPAGLFKKGNYQNIFNISGIFSAITITHAVNL